MTVLASLIATACESTADPTPLEAPPSMASGAPLGSSSPTPAVSAPSTPDLSPMPSASLHESTDLFAGLPRQVGDERLEYQVLRLDQYRTSYLVAGELRTVIERLAADPEDVPIAATYADPERGVSIYAIAFGSRTPDAEIEGALMETFGPELTWTPQTVADREVSMVEVDHETAVIFVHEGTAFMVLADESVLAEEAVRLIEP